MEQRRGAAGAGRVQRQTYHMEGVLDIMVPRTQIRHMQDSHEEADVGVSPHTTAAVRQMGISSWWRGQPLAQGLSSHQECLPGILIKIYPEGVDYKGSQGIHILTVLVT